MTQAMLLTTTPSVPGYRFDAVIGMVASSIATNPESAMQALWQESIAIGANAVVGVQISACSYTWGQGIAATAVNQFVASGTAVVVLPLQQGEEGWTRQSASVAMR